MYDWKGASSLSGLPRHHQEELANQRQRRRDLVHQNVILEDDTCVAITHDELLYAVKRGKSTAPGKDGLTYNVLNAIIAIKDNNPIVDLFNMSYNSVQFSMTQLRPLELIQNEAMRIILGCPRTAKIEVLRAELDMPSIVFRIQEIACRATSPIWNNEREMTVAAVDGCVAAVDGCVAAVDGCVAAVDGCVAAVDGCVAAVDGCVRLLTAVWRLLT
ncbi:hypothetical protein Pmani_020957, partial [Petrolisthes manimaculis]